MFREYVELCPHQAEAQQQLEAERLQLEQTRELLQQEQQRCCLIKARVAKKWAVAINLFFSLPGSLASVQNRDKKGMP